MRDHGAAHQERALEIDVDHQIPRFLGDFPEQATIGTVGGGGVVDEHVDPAELRERVRDKALGVSSAAHVSDQRKNATPEALDLPGEAIEALPHEAYFLEALLVLVACPACRHVRHDDVGTRAGNADRARPAHPAPSPTPPNPPTPA